MIWRGEMSSVWPCWVACISESAKWRESWVCESGAWERRLHDRQSSVCTVGFHEKIGTFCLSSHSDEGFPFFFFRWPKVKGLLCKNLHRLEEAHGLFSIVKSKGHSATVTKEIYWKKKLWMVVPSNDETQNRGSYMCNVKETFRSHKHSSKTWWFVKCWVLILFLWESRAQS